MAFCRWGPESDVYLYYSDGGYYCSNCLLEEGDEVSVKLNSAARHLQLHVDAGHKVPPGAITAVLADGEYDGD